MVTRWLWGTLDKDIREVFCDILASFLKFEIFEK